MNNFLKQKCFNLTSVYLKVLIYMKLTLLLVCVGIIGASANVFSQHKISVNYRNISLQSFLQDIEKKSEARFVYSDDVLKGNVRVSVRATNTDILDVLEEALKDKGLEVSKVNPNLYAIYRNAQTNKKDLQEREISGRIVNATGEGIPKVTFWFVGTRIGGATTEQGYFRILIPEGAKELEFRYIGYVTKRIAVQNGDLGNIILQSEDNRIEEVVINTGLYERKAGTFTGSTVTFNQKQIKEVSNQNVLSALSILDPSFQQLTNNDFGSNPNAIPDIQLRGQTGFSEDLRTEYSNIANQPLFIIDGFESTIQRVFDLNINFIKSVTILKDAAAKAMWGAKAGNGVVVIETLRPEAGKMRISYNASANVTAPDLSSYNLTNSMQKIEAETLAGVYSSIYPDEQAVLTREYAANLKSALDGVNTYWLSQPLRNGVGQRHTLSFDGGDESVQYSLNVGYNNNKGVMKGSDRTTYTGQSVLVYRRGKVSATNNLSIDRNFSRNSPYGSFGDYAKMNPYWRIEDEQGNLIPSYSLRGNINVVGNPLYNATLNTIDGDNYTTITENFQVDYRHSDRLRFNARLGYNQQTNENEFFRSARHTDYINISPSNAEYLNRGIFRLTTGFQKAVTVDLSAAYNKTVGRHAFYGNAVLTANEQSMNTTGMTMVGFPNDDLNSIAMGRQYLEGSKAVATENTVRIAAATTALNYAFDNRYLLDASYRLNGSSQYGRDSKWGNFWSLGLGWNLHQESFIKSLGVINLLRLTANTGVTGTPPGTNAYQALATYRYNTENSYNGDLGLDLLALANPNLKWQKVQESNYRAEIGMFDRFTASFDYYIRNTNNLLLSMMIAPSLGFEDYAENIGDVQNKGFQAALSYRLLKDRANGLNVNVFANLARNTNKINRISSSLELLNNRNDEQFDPNTTTGNPRRPVRRYVVGRSMNAIWAVPSLGIDPSNGKEIFVKQDGTLTYVWDAADQDVVGDTQPLFNGTFGANVQYKDLSVNFAFTYRWGGQIYNGTLVSRVDNADFNYNVDLRALEDRWKEPGDQTLFKDISDITATRPTSRFVQDLNEFLFSSVNVSYNMTRLRFLSRTPVKSLLFSCNLNDLGQLSTVKVERGLDYPYARTLSFSLTASF